MDGISPPPSTIRLPHRYFESGSKLQQRILPELRCSNRRKFDGNGNRSMEVEAVEHPPQLIRLFRSIRSELPAVDRSECETVSWAQKYCPISAAEVLQQGREAFMLKEWLQRLMVQAVDTGSGESGERKRLGSAKRLNSTKKRKKQLGDFIVSSGEEDDGYDELSEGEGDWGASGVHGIVKKTVVRSGDLRAMESKSPPYRLANTVVISGPHGSGKTAAVYAVAKELGFEVFEINSGSRRSGKDVLERIGDMTQNHLVSNQHSSVPGSGEDAADAIQEDDIAKEIKAGKQQTMGSFFSSKRASHLQKPTTGVLAGAAHTTAKKDVPKGQKQSLILLDEADILYEEDKQFWTTVTNLIAQSKRPFVMTCNDEALLPLQNLTLHGIFRFSHPPIDLAVDRLVLIAANEGHALRRVAVEALYESRNRDLRAATMDLNYWCQIGVGDRRGGFDWFYLRWPKGIDLDENKEVVRVVSGDTYQEGMNWVGHDHAVDSASDPRCVEDELLQQIRDFWDVDTSSWQLTTGVSAWAESVEDIARDPGGRLACLDAYHKFAEAMSASDIGSCRSWSKFKLDPIDPTLPKLASRVRDDYILGLQLLEAEPAIHYDPTLSSLPYTLRSMARQVLNLSTSPFSHAVVPELGPLTEDRVVSIIGHHFTSTPEDAPAVSRIDFALAFDPIAASDSPQYFSALTYLDPSVFDRTLELITLDVAPYVRSIVAYDVELQKRRSRLSSLLSEGGRKTANAKRMRTTRAAYSALEGGSRSTTRGERWFKADLNPYLVSKTAGQGWTQLVLETISARMAEEAEEGDQSRHGRRRRKEMRNVLKNDSDDEA
ncbi:hypothetical protein VTK73DRAFT_7756 [Phialemonium thermophilum]|uniref:AAA+ ATPase domain-containing protein n=1 Tax=Phialemonium thermophilum TaxID=223376 RepID=A0ABR3XSK2_9PEZI